MIKVCLEWLKHKVSSFYINSDLRRDELLASLMRNRSIVTGSDADTVFVDVDCQTDLFDADQINGCGGETIAVVASSIDQLPDYDGADCPEGNYIWPSDGFQPGHLKQKVVPHA